MTVPIIQVLLIHSVSIFRLEFLKGTENMKLYWKVLSSHEITYWSRSIRCFPPPPFY